MSADERLRPKAFATLEVVGDHLDPNTVTSAIDLTPTFSVRKGDTYRHGRMNREYVGRTGVWNYSTKGLVQSDNLGDHLSFLADLLGARAERLDAWLNLVRASGCRTGVQCFWYGPAGAEPSIPAWFNETVARIGGEVDLDFYPDDEAIAPIAAE